MISMMLAKQIKEVHDLFDHFHDHDLTHTINIDF